MALAVGEGPAGLAYRVLGNVDDVPRQSFDIHTGGVDNIFPHHENEIAQSEAATKTLLARYWFHVEHLLVNGQKMAKSLNNFYTLGDLLDRGYGARAIRYLLLSVHYQTPMNFTILGLQQASRAVEG